MQNLKSKRNGKGGISPLGLAMTVFVFTVFVGVTAVLSFFNSYEPDPNANRYPSLGTNPTVTGDNAIPVFDPNGGTAKPQTPSNQQSQVKGRYNFLVVGLDKVSRSTDIIMVVSYDIKNGEIHIVQIPRDTYMHIEGTNAVRVNTYYAIYYNRAKKNGSSDPEADAMKSLAALIERSLAIRLNYCAIVDLEGFQNIVDAVGGVYLDIPEDMYYNDPYQNLKINIKAGYQHLDGYHAMQFVRFRKGYVQQDIGRQNALKNFMSAFMKQIKENISVSMVVNLAGEVMANMKTDISAADFIYFGKSALSMDLSKVYMVTLPGEPTMAGKASVYVLYRDDTIAILNKYLNVLDTDITRSSFDPDHIMVKYGDDDVEKIYNMPLGSSQSSEYNAGDVNENPIHIPRK